MTEVQIYQGIIFVILILLACYSYRAGYYKGKDSIEMDGWEDECRWWRIREMENRIHRGIGSLEEIEIEEELPS